MPLIAAISSRAPGPGLGGITLTALLTEQGLLGADKDAFADSTGDTPQRAARSALAALHTASQTCPRHLLFRPCSHLDTWDYKPELIKRHGQLMPGNENLITFQGEQGNLTRSPYEFKPRGRSGKFISDLLPNLAELADEMCFIHSMTAKSNTHGPAENQMSTGFTLDGFPSMGAWVSYALGTESQDLPVFVAIPDPRGVPQTGPNNWSAGFLPAVFQGTAFNAEKPIPNLATPKEITSAAEISTRDF